MSHEDIKPMNSNQAEYIRCIEARDCDYVVSIGSAGTGKSYISTGIAAEQLLDKKIRKIVICRPAEGPCKSLGFEPGTLNEKLANWVKPVMVTLNEIMGASTVEYHLKKGNIELVALHQIKGRSFDDTILLIDEAEDIDIPTMKSLLTRLGSYSKMIINGDIKQQHMKGKSGLLWLVNMIEKYNLPIPVIEFTLEDCVRSPAVKMWLTVLEAEEDE